MTMTTRGPSAKVDQLASTTADNHGLGDRMALLREQKALSLDALARRAGLTKSYLSKIERGISVPSISTATRIAESFGLTVGQLLGEQQYDDAICVVRKSNRRSFMRAGSRLGYNYEMLAAGKKFKMMEPYIMRPPLEFQSDKRFEHKGQEFVLVLSGRIEVEFAQKAVVLTSGDSVYFDATVPHRSRSLDKKIAEVLVVVTL